MIKIRSVRMNTREKNGKKSKQKTTFFSDARARERERSRSHTQHRTRIYKRRILVKKAATTTMNENRKKKKSTTKVKREKKKRIIHMNEECMYRQAQAQAGRQAG